MNMEAIRELACKHLADRKAHREREKGFIFYHGERVGKIAVALREILLPGNSAKDEIMKAAAHFHDVAKGIEPHGEYGAVLVKEILKDHCSSHEIDEIAELIFYHQKRKKDPDYSEFIKIFQDADMLDHYGTIEIWMNFHYYAYMDQPIGESVKFYKEHFDQHAADMKNLLNFDVSLAIFEDKIRFIKSFADRMSCEANGEIYQLQKITETT
ncbi:MAG: hypothetical protein K0R50_625 [Eubacterium sp.]|jgi:uncharacterized protein|nr:hypothetical protein [Eubacterium sp.]